MNVYTDGSCSVNPGPGGYGVVVLDDNDNNINNLGLAMNSVKTSSLFADYNGKDGVYKGLMDALKGTEFSKYFDCLWKELDVHV